MLINCISIFSIHLIIIFFIFILYAMPISLIGNIITFAFVTVSFGLLCYFYGNIYFTILFILVYSSATIILMLYVFFITYSKKIITRHYSELSFILFCIICIVF